MSARRLAEVLVVTALGACVIACGAEPSVVTLGNRDGGGSTELDGSSSTGDTGTTGDGGAGVDSGSSTDPGSDGGMSGSGDGGGTGEGDGGPGSIDGETGCGPTEICGNGLDDDCDGQTEERCGCEPGDTQPCYDGLPAEAGRGVCSRGTQTCTGASGTEFGTWSACEGAGHPSAETCGDGADDDCDGVPDDGCACTPGETRDCYEGPPETAGVGICSAGTQTCMAIATGSDWGTCEGQTLPAAMDACDGTDTDCDGVPDDGCDCVVGTSRACYSGTAETAGVGICREGSQTCIASAGGAAWGACEGEVLPGTEVCGNATDDDCDGEAEETCAGTLTCPSDVSVPAGQPVTLTVTGMGVSGYSWTIVSAPPGGELTSTWAPASRTSATETFTPFIVGEYVIMVTATDAAGRAVTCMVRVTALPHGLRVQLSWDGFGDVDLHLHDGTTAPWFNDNDCWYSNLTTTWGAVLDFDNVISDGPENIRIDAPVVGTTYTVGIHNYEGASGRHATVQIFCGSTDTTPTATFTSRALSGGGIGDCTGNDFWRVARVVFSDPSTCTITPIDTYTPSTNACGAL